MEWDTPLLQVLTKAMGRGFFCQVRGDGRRVVLLQELWRNGGFLRRKWRFHKLEPRCFHVFVGCEPKPVLWHVSGVCGFVVFVCLWYEGQVRSSSI